MQTGAVAYMRQRRMKLQAAVHEHLGAILIEAEIHPLQTQFTQNFGHARLVAFFTVKHQKTTAARARDLSAQRAGRACFGVALINFGVGYAGRKAFLGLPVLI